MTTNHDPLPRIYISLPISNYDYAERKAYARHKAAWLEEVGFTPVNPLENGLRPP